MDDNMDRNINWKQFYSQYVKNLKPTGANKMTGLCPFHQDTKPSFWFNTENGCWKCEACGESGNGQTFLQKIENISSAEAYKRLLALAGIEPKPKAQRAKYTVQDYADAKRLPLDFLTSLGVKNGHVGVSIPYMDESGKILSTRQRYAPDSSVRFSWARGSKVSLYGLWMMSSFRKQGYIVLVEGESDAHTLWFHGIPALGVPGASTFQTSWVDYLEGLKIYIHKEPDQGGEVFVRKICEALAAKQFKDDVYEISISGCKDPSDLHISDPLHFDERWKAVMEAAQAVDVSEVAIKVDPVIEGAPVQLRVPAGWRISANGIEVLNDKTGLWALVCKTPILLSRRLKSLDTGEEKIEIAFMRDGKWHTYITQRSTIFQSRSITQLADVGITVTSENAKALVRYLQDLEADNFDLLKLNKAVTQLGWYGKNFIPGAEGELVIDVDPASRRWIDAYSQEGTLREWIEAMKPYRSNSIFRFIMAGAFAAPLLKLINHRVFIIHNWGDSRSGKTAALKAALSVWGDPDSLLANFNATRVGLERLASFFNDLPLGIDEKQVAGKRQDFIESLVYMLSLGTSKTRGTKTGGLQSSKSWRSIIITTGEEPLSVDSSQTGIHSRAMEIYGSPFASETEAAKMHDIAANVYGHAGPEFIKRLITELSNDANLVKDMYRQQLDILSNSFERKIESHLSSIAIVSVADMLASRWIFGEPEEISLDMVYDIIDKLEDSIEADVVEQAYEFVRNWLMSNDMQFDNESGTHEIRGEKYGFVVGNTYNVFPHVLKRALEREGFSYRKTLQGFADRGKITTVCEGDKRRTQILKWYEGRPTRFVEIDLDKVEMPESPPF